MLITPKFVEYTGEALGYYLAIFGGKDGPDLIEKGVYKSPGFNNEYFLDGDYEKFISLSGLGYPDSYGVCDDYSQILNHFPVILNSKREFVIFVTPILKSEEPETGGWRWHKWGEYIGMQNPTMEYLADEPNIDKVYVFEVFEKISNNAEMGD